MPADDSQSPPDQEDACRQGGGAGHQGGDVDPEEPFLGPLGLGADGVGEGIQPLLCGGAGRGCVPVGDGVGRLGLAVGAGADQVHQGVPEGVIVRQHPLVYSAVLLCDIGRIIRQQSVQGLLLRLDFLDQSDHCGVVRRYDVAQRQTVYVHQGAPDIRQLGLAGHVLIHDGPGAGVDAVDAGDRQQVGDKGDQSQQKNGDDEPLLQGKFAFHSFPPESECLPRCDSFHHTVQLCLEGCTGGGFPERSWWQIPSPGPRICRRPAGAGRIPTGQAGLRWPGRPEPPGSWRPGCWPGPDPGSGSAGAGSPHW